MALTPVIQRAFSAGEIAPGLGARADLPLFAAGLRTCRNFLVQKTGGIANRPGTRFVAQAKESAGLVKLYRWEFTAAEASVLIEAGDQYFRFYQNGVPITVSGVDHWDVATNYIVGDLVELDHTHFYCVADNVADPPPSAAWYALEDDIYEIPTPYTAGSFDSPGPLRFTQNGALITITHTAYAPRELANLTGTGAPRWTLTLLVLAPAIAAPANFTWTPGIPGPSGGHTYAYQITAVAESNYEESLPTTPDSAAGVGEPTLLLPNALSWDAVTGAKEYRIYLDPFENGTFGYIGTATDQVTFKDVGFAPDFSLTPPVDRQPFPGALDWPELSASYQQRRMFAYTDNKPATVWCSRVGFLRNFTIRSPLQDDDAVEFTAVSNTLEVIRHLVALRRLIMLTSGGEWIVRGDADGAVTPTTIALDQVGYAGASRVIPVVIGNAVIYVQARGSVVRDLQFDAVRSVTDPSLNGRDLTTIAGHLFEGYTIGRLAFALVPHSIVWAVRSDGTLLGMTYLTEDNTWGWHRHDTAGGLFEDVCVVPEDDEDMVYVVVQRTIDGQSVRYIERLTRRFVTAETLEDAVFVDCAVTYDGSPTTSLTGLDHLEGEEVVAFTDGTAVQGPFTVEGGAITLTTAASVAQVGLAITAQAETLNLDVQGTAVRGTRKRVQSVIALVEASVGGFYAGPDEDHLFVQRRELWQPATGLLAGQMEVNLTCTFGDGGRVVLQHTAPTPLTIVGVIPRFEPGG